MRSCRARAREPRPGPRTALTGTTRHRSNAAVAITKLFGQITEAEFDLSFTVNVKGAFHGMQLAFEAPRGLRAPTTIPVIVPMIVPVRPTRSGL